MQEFVELVNESDLLNHRSAILEQSEKLAAGREQKQKERQDVWKIGLPVPSGLAMRPTLAQVSADALNQQEHEQQRVLVRRNSLSRPSLAAPKMANLLRLSVEPEEGHAA